MSRAVPDSDFVDHMVEQWSRERPDLNMGGIEIIGRISRLARHFERQIESSFAMYGLNGPGFYVLASLRRSGSPYCLSPTQLYSSLLVSSGTMTHRLERLEEAGLIRRVPDPSDGRSSLVALTDHGHKVIDLAMENHTSLEMRLLEGLSGSGRRDLANRLRQLLLLTGDRPLEESGNEAPSPLPWHERSGSPKQRRPRPPRHGASP